MVTNCSLRKRERREKRIPIKLPLINVVRICRRRWWRLCTMKFSFQLNFKKKENFSSSSFPGRIRMKQASEVTKGAPILFLSLGVFAVLSLQSSSHSSPTKGSPTTKTKMESTPSTDGWEGKGGRVCPRDLHQQTHISEGKNEYFLFSFQLPLNSLLVQNHSPKSILGFNCIDVCSALFSEIQIIHAKFKTRNQTK